MRTIFIADIETSETDGIFKKIISQVAALSIDGECILINKCKGIIFVSKYIDGTLCEKYNLYKSPENNNLRLNRLLNHTASDFIQKYSPDNIYIRHMMKPSFSLLKLLKVSRKMKCKIYYEIPTYPYFGEQYFASLNKIKTTVRLTLECLMWPFIYRYIDKLVVIKSRENIKIYKKMFAITNGINAEILAKKQYTKKTDKFKILGLGTIYKYHGYEKIINGIYNCGGYVDGKSVEFHIVGESEEIENLKALSYKLKLNNHILFHGKQYKDELDEIFNQMNIAIGCLALYRRNADIDTTLKVIEYLVRGIPFVTSGKIANAIEKNATYLIVENNNEPVNIGEVYKFANEVSIKELKSSSLKYREKFSWKSIMRNVLSE